MRALLLAFALVLIGLLGAAPAQAQTVTVNTVQGRILYSWRGYDAYTGVIEIVGVGLPATTKMRLTFACSNCPNGVYDDTKMPDASGFVDMIPRSTFTIGIGKTWTVTLTDAQGRVRTVVWTAHGIHAPSSVRTCTQADGAAMPCQVGCDPHFAYPPGDVCQGAGSKVSIPNSRVRGRFSGKGSTTTVRQLRVSGIPPGAVAILMCRGTNSRNTGCPVFLHPLKPHGGVVNATSWFHGWKLKPGVQILIWLVRGNTERGDVVRYTMRKGRKPRFEKLCMKPAELTPTRC